MLLLYAPGTFASDETSTYFGERHTTRASRLPEERNTCDKVLARTSYIESMFQKKPKSGAVLIDLSAALDTVWQAGLMMKLSKSIKCRTTIRLIASLISQRNVQVFLGNHVSRKRTLKKVFPKDPYLCRRSSTYTSVTSLQLSR